VKVLAKMFHLQGSQVFQMLEKSLRSSLPESLKVYGTVFHMNQGNPFKEMADDFDHYTNSYQIYSKDPQNCQKLLGTSDVINWKQHLQIQSSQSSLHEAIQNVAAAKLVKVTQTQGILYMLPNTVRKLLPSLAEANLPLHNQEMFKVSSLDVTHAALVNKFWHFGGNERSQRFVERCIWTFPTTCLLGPEGTPVSWSLMDYTGEMRMGATLPEYRFQGLIYHTMCNYTQILDELGFPLYNHTDRANKAIQKMSRNLHHTILPCDWNQWHCVPL
ncbi:hypothetical protein MC885_005322, partial [Smutsia gigantea]